jgi:hypothetical protein
MSSAAAQVIDMRRSGAWRAALTWMVLLAFALQSYITQTHIHNPPAPAGRAAIAEVVSAGGAPADREDIACPFCQAVAAAGAFFAATPVVATLPAAQARTPVSPPAVLGLHLASAGFNWRSRAPPQS